MVDVKMIEMLFEGHEGPGGQAYRGRDVALGREINVSAGSTVMVSEALAVHLARCKGWRRAEEPDPNVTGPPFVVLEGSAPKPRRGKKG